MTQTTLPAFSFAPSDDNESQPARAGAHPEVLVSVADVPVGRAERYTMLGAVLLPLIGLGLAIAFLWGRGITWLELGLFVAMYVITAGGVTVGYHRLFTH